VATIKGRAVCQAYWRLHENEPCIIRIFVLKKNWRIGVLTMLMKNIEVQIKHAGFSTRILLAHVINSGQLFFNKRGYNQIDACKSWILYQKNIK